MIDKRLREMRKYFGMTQVQFAERIGTKQGNVADWERGRAAPSLEAMHGIVKGFNVNLHWLLTGQGDMMLPAIDVNKQQQDFKKKVFDLIRNELTLLENNNTLVAPEKNDFWYIPVTGDIKAGDPMPFKPDNDPVQHLAVPKKKLANPSICEVLRVNGDSMEPKIEHSDLVVVKREDDYWMCHNKVVAIKTPDGLTLKKLVIDFEKNSACLVPFNQKYPVDFLDEDSKVLGLDRLHFIGQFLYRE